MNRIAAIFGILLISLLFGLALTLIQRYPFQHDLQIFTASSTIFGFIQILLIRFASDHIRRLWLAFGLVTFCCWLTAMFWFWVGVMQNGWWLPPLPEVIQHFWPVDGEAGYWADTTNLFLVLWPAASLILITAYAWWSRRTQSPKFDLSVSEFGR